MPDIEDRAIGELRIRIDRTLCVGFGDCVDEAPEVFRLDDTGVATFAGTEALARERLLRACEACPVDALTVWDRGGRQLIP